MALTFLIVIDLQAQNITELYVVDGFSKPYLELDDGVSFRYHTVSLGDITVIFKRGNASAIPLLRVKEEHGSIGYIRISPSTLMNLIKCNVNMRESNFLYLSHLDFYTKYLSKKEIPLSIETIAPYGCSLFDLPTRPALLSTELKKKKIGFSSAIGMLAGGALVINGLSNREKYSENGSNPDESKFNVADGNIYVGALIFIFSYTALRIFALDEQQNNLNKRKNEIGLRNWKIEVRRVKKLNQQIKITYTILIK